MRFSYRRSRYNVPAVRRIVGRALCFEENAMSTRSCGNARERAFERRLWEHGFRVGDLIAHAPIDSGLPHIVAEVGSVGKRLAVTFAELHEHALPPGFAAVVARCVARRWWFYTSPDERFEDFTEFLDALPGGDRPALPSRA
jgi:hypothetical protein